MNKLPGNIVAFDTDDTLIYWDADKFLHPEDVRHNCNVEIKFKGKKLIRVVMADHVSELKLQKESGQTVVVWSASGVDWAEAVVKALKIEEYVDLVMSKPTKLYDDMEASEWMPKVRHLIFKKPFDKNE